MKWININLDNYSYLKVISFTCFSHYWFSKNTSISWDLMFPASKVNFSRGYRFNQRVSLPPFFYTLTLPHSCRYWYYMKYANLQSILSEIFLALVLNRRSSCKVQQLILWNYSVTENFWNFNHGRRHLEGLKWINKLQIKKTSPLIINYYNFSYIFLFQFKYDKWCCSNHTLLYF